MACLCPHGHSLSRITRFHVTPSHIASRKYHAIHLCAMGNTIRRLHHLWYFSGSRRKSTAKSFSPFKAYLLFPKLSPITQRNSLLNGQFNILYQFVYGSMAFRYFVDAIEVNSNGFLFAERFFFFSLEKEIISGCRIDVWASWIRENTIVINNNLLFVVFLNIDLNDRYSLYFLILSLSSPPCRS